MAIQQKKKLPYSKIVKPKLTPFQKEILLKMMDTWKLKSQNSFGFSCWITEDREDYWGISISIQRRTLMSLIREGVINIDHTDKYKHTYYRLTKRGMDAIHSEKTIVIPFTKNIGKAK